jgi:hypothetical protein
MKYKKTKSTELNDSLVLNVINQIIDLFPEFENKKKTIINKLTELKDGLVLNVINQIIDLFPEFENKKKTIINKLTNINNIEEPTYSDIIFDKIILNDIVYYKDRINYLWDANALIIGIYQNDTTYYLFDEINKLNKEIIDSYKNINESTNELLNN